MIRPLRALRPLPLLLLLAACGTEDAGTADPAGDGAPDNEVGTTG